MAYELCLNKAITFVNQFSHVIPPSDWQERAYPFPPKTGLL